MAISGPFSNPPYRRESQFFRAEREDPPAKTYLEIIGSVLNALRGRQGHFRSMTLVWAAEGLLAPATQPRSVRWVVAVCS